MNDDAILTKPVVIVGSARSGTTILGELLQVHSTLFGIVEPRFTWRYGNDKKSDMLSGDDATPKIISYIRSKFAERVRRSGHVRLLEKTPSNSLRLEFVERVFPDCKIIHIIRNGIDASLSIQSYWHQAAQGIKGVDQGKFRERTGELEFWRIPSYAMEALRRFAPWPISKFVGPNLWGPRIPGLREMLRELELIEVCALQWRTCVELAQQYGETMPADRYMELRLEDLSLDTFREVLAFAELEEEPVVIENFQKVINPARPTGRRVNASSAELQLLSRWITSTMERLDYPTTLLSQNVAADPIS